MQSVNEFQFYELAISIHPLTEANEQVKYSDIWLDWSNAGQALYQIFTQRALEFCLPAANELYTAIGNIVPHDFSQAMQKWRELPNPEPELGWGLINPLRQAAGRFETVLSAELSNSDLLDCMQYGTWPNN